jgi:hypothetical protein
MAMDEIKYPTWRDVGIPDNLVQSIKQIKTDILLEQLIYERVLHNNRRLQYIYVCGVCGHQHKAEKSTDDYGFCGAAASDNGRGCGSRAVRATQQLRGWTREHTAGCSHTDQFANEVLGRMRQNYSRYFKDYMDDFPAEDIVLFRWRQEGYVASFQGGESVVESSTARALCKASLLVPFLWDTRFDWKTNQMRPKGRLKPIFPCLYEWVQRG